MSPNALLLLLPASFLSAVVLVPIVRSILIRRSILDQPNERSSHSVPTPRGGGIAIAGVTLLSALLILGGDSWPPRKLVVFLASSLLVAVVGWLDDLYRLSNRVRSVASLSAAVLLIWQFGVFREIPLPPASVSIAPGLGFVLSVLWIVGLTNAYNFMDGIDGIAGLQAVIGGLGLVWLGYSSANIAVWLVALAAAGSAAGFLVHNWQPARIFMGDVGSTFLGFAFAALILDLTSHDSVLLLAGALLFWPFLFDTSFTFVRRLFRGERVFEAHRGHLYQRLVQTGMSHRTVTILYGCLSVAGGMLAHFLMRRSLSVSHALVAALGLAGTLWILTIFLERRRA